MYYWDSQGKTYRPLDNEIYGKIQGGEVKF